MGPLMSGAGSPLALDREPAASRKARILIVDDNPLLLAGCSEILRTGGYKVATASSGEEAIAVLQSAPFDVVVTDILMPGTDGVALLKAVRRERLDVAVVLMTGSPEVHSAVQAIEYGAARYLIKPFGMREFRQAVEHAYQTLREDRQRRDSVSGTGVIGIDPGDTAALEASFERALSTLWMAYQPIVKGEEGRVFGYEALVRSDEASIPHPGVLFSLSERLGRLHDLGRAIRDNVAGAMLQAPPGCFFFVNLHARELVDEQLYESGAALSRLASRVVLEITERTSVDQVSDLRRRVAELRRMGFRIAIDDLGSGYAGLSSMATLEPEVVKLDMSLVRNAHREPLKRRLISWVTSLCRESGTLVVAEGIETAEERDAMVSLGCELLQGYLLGCPARSFPSPAPTCP